MTPRARLTTILAALGVIALYGVRARRINAVVNRYARQQRPEVVRRQRLSAQMEEAWG